MNGVLLEALQADGTSGEMAQRLRGCAAELAAINDSLRGIPGLRCMLSEPRCIDLVDRKAGAVQDWVEKLEHRVNAHATDMSTEALEEVHVALVEVRDLLWAIRRDRVAWGRAVTAMAGPDPSEASLEGFASIQTALSALDRLEVRGRDSAGIHVLVMGHDLDLEDPEVDKLLDDRRRVTLFRSSALRTPAGHLGFVYKVASEVGELGDNVRSLRTAITNDALLHRAVRADGAAAVVVAHTRWASAGTINEANAHPVDAEGQEQLPGPYVVAALNGDVDNHLELAARHRLRMSPQITTDAKVIPVLVASRLATGMAVEDAFRETVSELAGSVAIAASAAAAPEKQLLAVRGSGQALYVGLTEDTYVVASEPYGLVEEASQYLRVDGDAHGSAGVAGQVLVLDREGAGTLEGLRRLAYDGTELPIQTHEVLKAEITTRDIDRGGHPHYLLKEISEAPASMRRTLRGRIGKADGLLVTRLGGETLPPVVRRRLSSGQIKRIVVIGQGTAAVAGMAVAAAMRNATRNTNMVVAAMPASELSGFGLSPDMTDTLIVAITQSGTTTDTNRTVELLRARGALVVAIVNRRNSDITHRCDGLLFTSDGRDVEMSVASTKAFYSQVAAGMLLAFAVAEEAGTVEDLYQHDVLHALQALPERMERVLANQRSVREVATKFAPSRRHWAVVGNGNNLIAAEEIRIKLSELCYKSVAVDATEDKKHIDLSSEPLTVVCAAGLTGAGAADVAKEVAIFRAHRGATVVIATEGETAFRDLEDVISVPATHPELAYLLSTMVGHLFGYEAALAVDAQAAPLRGARAALEHRTSVEPLTLDGLLRAKSEMVPAMTTFEDGLLSGQYDAALSCRDAARILSLFRSFGSSQPDQKGVDGVEGLRSEVDGMLAALSAGISDLTRPVDAIKHQAKTVTVGITRRESLPFEAGLVERVMEATGASDRLTPETLRSLRALKPAVAEVTGFTRYELEGDAVAGTAVVLSVERRGSARNLASRTERDGRLRGTKQFVASEGSVLVTRGAVDRRMVIIVPETADAMTTALVLLHVRLQDRLPSAQMMSVLEGYRDRLALLKSMVVEIETASVERPFGTTSVEYLLTAPMEDVAALWPPSSHRAAAGPVGCVTARYVEATSASA